MSKAILIAFVMIAAGVFGFSGAASAFPVMSKPALQSEADASAIVEVKHGRYHGNRHHNYHSNYNRRWNHRYGHRCSGWTNYCRYRYNGYWYSNQWWLGPVIGSAIIAGASNSSRHVRWCENRYRSYNPRNNTWISSSGKVKKCDSPYN